MTRKSCVRPALRALLWIEVALHWGSGEVIEGHAAAREGWAFLGKFSFGVTDPKRTVTHPAPSAPGWVLQDKDLSYCSKEGPDVREEWMQTVTIQLRAPHPHHAVPGLRVYLYDDQETSWPSIYDDGQLRDDVSCSERAEVFHFSEVHGGHLRGVLPCDGVIPVWWDDQHEFKFTRAISQRLRPRTWYAVLGHGNCSAIPGVQYRLEFLNEADNQFGTDEDGLLSLYLCGTLAMASLLGVQWRSRVLWMARAKHLAGQLPRLLQLSCSCATLGCGLFFAHYLVFSVDGNGLPWLRFCAGCAQAASKLVLVLVLLLLGQGWTILRAQVQQLELLLALIAALSFVTFSLLVWGSWPATPRQEEAGGVAAWLKRDPASSRYIYDEPPGQLLLLLDAASAIFFLGCARRTLASPELAQHQEPKQLLLLRIGAVLFFVYLLITPMVVVMAAHALDPWVRQFWIRAIEVLSIFGSNAVLCYAIWPAHAESYFLHFGHFSSASRTRSSSISTNGTGGGGEHSNHPAAHKFEEIEQEQASLVVVEAGSA